MVLVYGSIKIITGDNRLVAATVSKQLGLAEHEILTGPKIEQMSGRALMNKVTDVDLFAEIEPNQKERIIIALKKAGVVSAALIVFVVRSSKPFVSSPPRQLPHCCNTHHRRDHYRNTLYADCALNRFPAIADLVTRFTRHHRLALYLNG